MEFLLATNNEAKKEEFKAIFEQSGHSIVTYADLELEVNPNEDGKTFEENAIKKACAGSKASGLPTVADDSGLCVDVLGGAPGIHSSRFAGEGATDSANRKKLLSLLERTPYAKRTAHFECCVALCMPDGRTFAASGEFKGVIGFAEHGENGFGYDSIFYANNKSFADLEPEEKNKISHRSAAIKNFVEKLPEFLGAAAAAAKQEEAAGTSEADEAVQEQQEEN